MPIFSLTFPLKGLGGRNIGGMTIVQDASFVEEDIRKAEWSIVLTVLVLIGGTVTLILFATRRWIARPISELMDGIQKMAKGDLNTHIDLKKGDELSRLAQAFNQMATSLKEAQERIFLEAETRLELERNLRHSEKLATIGHLASGLAHEIGTPLNIIGGRADLAKKRLDDKESTRKNLEVIIHQAERITKIIQQLLGFVRKKKPDEAPLNVVALLENTLDFLDHQIRKQGVRIVKDLSNDLSPVRGDPDQLQQVFLNLILNALQSMPNGGTLSLTAAPKGISRDGLEDSLRQYIEIGVGDSGGGMTTEVIQNIFIPFFTTKDKGTGLGLTVSQGIVQDHDGWVEVDSQLGKGSVFKVYLPSASIVGQ